jgi:hypothetical protein
MKSAGHDTRPPDTSSEGRCRATSGSRTFRRWSSGWWRRRGRAGIPQAGFPGGQPRYSQEVLVCLTRMGLVAHDAMVAGALERNQRLLVQLSEEEAAYCRDMSIVWPMRR